MGMKVNRLQQDECSAVAKYRAWCYGNLSWFEVCGAEFIQTFCGSWPGALGLWLRAKLYPALFAAVGSGAVFGRHLTLRHPHKIRIGRNVIIDDNVVLDAKGNANLGITIGNNVYIGRNTIIYCKNGDIAIESGVNISANCQIFSAHRLTIGRGTIVGAFSYLLSGGEYDLASAVPFAEQDGKPSRGDLTIGPNCWLGAHVVVLDGASIGAHSVIGAGAVVTRPVESRRLALGIPARAVKTLGEDA